MKKNLIIIISIIIIAIIALFIYFKTSENKIEGNNTTPNNISANTTEGISTVLTLEDEIQNNSIWCGTFQLIWNDLKNDLAKQDIIFTPQLKVVENLNKETFTTNDIAEASYYKTYGRPTLEFKEEIEKAIKEKFDETSDILNDFSWGDAGPNDYLLYTMLRKNFEFEKEFEDLGKGKFGKYEDISYFGIQSSEKDQLRNQVEVLYYNSKDDFAIKLKTKQNDEVVLCKNPKGKNFNEIYENIQNENKNFEGRQKLQEDELLKIPNIKLKEKNEFKELEKHEFQFSDGRTYIIDKAIQTIQLELDKKGGKIKSEAGMSIRETALINPEEKREFSIDNTFAMFLKEENKDKPYFGAKIEDITKFQ